MKNMLNHLCVIIFYVFIYLFSRNINVYLYFICNLDNDILTFTHKEDRSIPNSHGQYNGWSVAYGVRPSVDMVPT